MDGAARELGYPERPVCFKPVFSSGSRGFRILDPTVDRAHQLLNERPGSVAMRLEEAVELLPDEGGPDLLVMELATGGERTIDGIGNGREIVLGHPKTREAMRAGLAMYFVTLEDEELMRTANLIVAELGIEHFFNIQLVGEHVIEINPRISTIVYQEDLNLPYLGVKRALGELSDDELARVCVPHPPGPNRAPLLRPARVRPVTLRARAGRGAPLGQTKLGGSEPIHPQPDAGRRNSSSFWPIETSPLVRPRST